MNIEIFNLSKDDNTLTIANNYISFNVKLSIILKLTYDEIEELKEQLKVIEWAIIV